MRRVLVCAAVFFAGCPSVQSVDAGAAAGQFCVDWQLAIAQYFADCGAYSSTERFRELARPCTLTPHQRFDAVKAKACLDSYQNRPCGVVGLGVCLEVITGTRGEGAPCFEGECRPELSCDQSSACPGVCRPRGEPGAPATWGCVDGAAAHDGVCVLQVALGGACAPPTGSTNSLPCVTGAVCGPNGLCIAYTRSDAGTYCQYELGLTCGDGLQCIGDGCQPLARPGEACGGGRVCQYDLTCENATCTAPRGPGEPCEAWGQCLSSLFCGAPEGDPVVRTCKALLTQGQDCFVEGYQCARGLTCVPVGDNVDKLGQCQPQAPRGAACTQFGEVGFCQPGLYCDASPLNPQGSCVDTKTSGKCERDEQCQSDWCEADGGCRPSCFAPVP